MFAWDFWRYTITQALLAPTAVVGVTCASWPPPLGPAGRCTCSARYVHGYTARVHLHSRLRLTSQAISTIRSRTRTHRNTAIEIRIHGPTCRHQSHDQTETLDTRAPARTAERPIAHASRARAHTARATYAPAVRGGAVVRRRRRRAAAGRVRLTRDRIASLPLAACATRPSSAPNPEARAG